MIQWQQCNEFTRELKKLGKKQRNLEDGFEKVKRLLSSYFDKSNPNTEAIASGKIHHLSSYTDWELWKVEVVVIGLKPNLWPRMWFAICGETITFLAIDMHNNNYSDGEVTQIAIERFAS